MSTVVAVEPEEIVSMATRFVRSMFPSCDAALYGSTVRNARRPSSDVDLLVFPEAGDYPYRERRLVAGFTFDVAVVSYAALPQLIAQTRERRNRYFDKIGKSGIFVTGSNRRLMSLLLASQEERSPLSPIQLRATLTSLLSDLSDSPEQRDLTALIFEAYRMLVAAVALEEQSELGPLPIIVKGLPDARYAMLATMNQAVRHAVNGRLNRLIEVIAVQLDALGGPPGSGESFPLF